MRVGFPSTFVQSSIMCRIRFISLVDATENKSAPRASGTNADKQDLRHVNNKGQIMQPLIQ